MKKSFFFFFLMIGIATNSCFAQSNGKVNTDSAYTQTINARAEKIVSVLQISDPSKFAKVKNIIAGQYRNLNDIYTVRDEQIKAAKMQLNDDKEGLKKSVAEIQQRTDSQIAALHPKFLSILSKELTAKQIDQVKDGMTYNVLHVTYTGYNQMILNLTDAQKKQIMDWLIEAREHAMDAESSDKKHAWFGKYKGRINNYLSAAGYDLKKEGIEWEKRRNAAVKN
jgi:hypothetical protein